MGWLYDTFHKNDIDKFSFSFTEWEQILCKVHSRIKEGNLTIKQVTDGMDILFPDARFRFLSENGYVEPFKIDGHETVYKITKKGIHMAEELERRTGEDGKPLLGNHE